MYFKNVSIYKNWYDHHIFVIGCISPEAHGSLVVKALGYKPEGCGFET
jgi:hypothetical protein